MEEQGEIRPEDIIIITFNKEGYHEDIEVTGFDYKGDGVYDITIKNLGKSDKIK